MDLNPGADLALELQSIRNLLWGPQTPQTIFTRWAQGFTFSEAEPSALVQLQGGPCGVIAPVQAFLLKFLLAETTTTNWKNVTAENSKALLIQAICSILTKSKGQEYRIVSVGPRRTTCDTVDARSVFPPIEQGAALSADASIAAVDDGVEAMEGVSVMTREDGFCPDEYHDRLQVTVLQHSEEVITFYSDHFEVLSGDFGVLVFLYSVLLTKGTENVMAELNDVTEPLIHATYGYGSQGLINLMLTGRAIAHVFDNFQDVDGLRLMGLSQQADVGFITLMEQYRLCTVGSFYKNPKSPVWVMGSDTHLTVLFSNEMKLVSPETRSEMGKRIFKSHDPGGNNFIESDKLYDILTSVKLFNDMEYVNLMKQKLDPEKLGIILLNAFMEEYFPEESRSVPDMFQLWHYNGIPGSNVGHQVKYNAGAAIMLESDLPVMVSGTPMLNCLQTKWPNIEVTWSDSRTPSLN